MISFLQHCAMTNKLCLIKPALPVERDLYWALQERIAQNVNRHCRASLAMAGGADLSQAALIG
jgi:hypothetical protein